MRQVICRRHGLRRSRLLFAAATAVVAGFAGRASAQNFVGPGSNWNTGANWSTGSVPVAGSSSVIAPSTTSSFSVGYNYTGPAIKLGILSINTPNNALGLNRLNIASNALSAGTELVGISGGGEVVQFGGTNTADFLDLGFSAGGTGGYGLSNSGALSAAQIFVGGNSGGAGGQGVLSVSGGTLTTGATGTLTVYNTSGTGVTLSGGTISVGSLNLSNNFGLLDWIGGTLNFINTNFIPTIDTAAGGGNLASTLTLVAGQVLTSAGNENVGLNGTGTLTQTGGVNVVSSELALGVFTGSSGTYNLSGTGSLAAFFEVVGANAKGLFNQTGGTNNIGDVLDIGFNPNSIGTYLLSAGTLNAPSVSVGDGDSGVKAILNVSGSGVMNVSGTLTATSTPGTGITLSGGTINTAALNLNGTASLLNWSSGTLGLTAGVTFDSAAGSTTTGAAFGNSLNVGGSQTLNVTGNESIGNTSSFALTVNGGLNNVSGFLTVDSTSGTSTFNLSNGGSLTVNGSDGFGVSEYIGFNGAARFNQSSGTNTVSGEMDLGENGSSTGTYLLSGGTLSAGSFEEVGYSATGIFNQSGGSNSLGQFLEVGSQSGSTGTYVMSAGSLSAVGGERIGLGGVGIFNQTGGTNTFSSGFIAIGIVPGAAGSYSLSGGTMMTQNAFVGGGKFGGGGMGVLTVSGTGLMNVSGTLQAYNTAGSGITLSGGTINTAALNLNGTPSLFNWTGGTLGLTAGVTFDPSAGSTTTSAAFGSSLIVGSSKTLNVTGEESLGGGSAFALTVNGGQNNINGFLNVDSTNGTSTFNLSNGGSLTVNGADGAGISEYIGYEGAALFNQSGGTNTASAEMDIGEFGSSTVTYLLSGGTLSVGNYEFVAFLSATTFNQSGGLNTAGTELEVGASDGSNGNYLLSGGTVAAPNINVGGSDFFGGAGNGIFIQTGGASIVSGELNLGYNVGSIGTYILSGGKLSSPSIYVGGSSAAAGGTGVLTVKNSGQLSAVGLLQVYNSGRVNLDVPNTAVGNLTIVGNGIVNLNGALTINYGSPGNDPVASVLSYLKSGYNGGAWTGTAGIISTSVAGSPLALTVGYVDGNKDSNTVAGPNQMVVKTTLTGDANLDGTVSFTDLVAVIQNFNKSGTDWATGNFHYGTITNFNDLVAVVQNFNKTAPPSGSASELGGTTIALGQSAQIQSDVVRLPEPGAFGFFAAGAAGVMCRRRHRKARIARGPIESVRKYC